MAEDTSNRLRFSIEESLWLNKGQEVDEIVSMSLEPDISIVENKHYVSVRGSLRLTGEYRPLPEEQAASSGEPSIDEDRSLQGQPLRPVDELAETEDGTIQMEHRFPVDITIPLSRIERLEDIYVVVDSFDYTLPQNDCLQLEADISISGMAEEEENRSEEASEQEEENVEPVATASDLRNAEEDWEATEEAEENELEPFHYEAVREASEEEQEDAFDEPAAVRNRGPLVEMKSRASESEEYSAFYGYGDEAEEDEGEEYYEEEDWEDEEERSPQRSRHDENALYLTKMMAKDEDAFSRLKMCIIQRGESLDTIAQRYEMPLTQLLRVNRLESEEVKEGQILYIPVSS